jgi:NADPH-dependent curcumin reductase CurA
MSTPSLQYSSRRCPRLDNRVGGLVSGSDIARLFGMTIPEHLRTSREVRLAARPKGEPAPSDFAIVAVVLDEPKEGEVLVENSYMSVDPYMRGRMSDQPSYVPPFQINKPLDGSAVGRVLVSRSETLAEGDYVLHRYGWRERVVAPATEFAKIDPTLAPVRLYLSVFGMTGLTAYVGLLDIAALRGDETVFVSAAAGAVGSIACQIARIKGCRVIGSAGSKEKVEWLERVARVAAAFDYKTTDDLEAMVKRLAPKGIDVYFDNVGGEHLEAAIACMNREGRVALCGMISGYNAIAPSCAPRNLHLAIGKRLTLRGFIVGDHANRRAAFLLDMSRWLADGEIKFEETIFRGIEAAPQAFIAMLNGKNMGKMIVELTPG